MNEKQKPQYSNIWAGYPSTPFFIKTNQGELAAVLAIVYDPDIGCLAEVQWPTGAITYGWDARTEGTVLDFD